MPGTQFVWELQDYADDAHRGRALVRRCGGGGRPLGTGGPSKAHAYEGDPRLYIAAEALTASPEIPRTHLAAALAKQHGSSPRTWERLLTQAARTPAQ